MRPQKRAGLPTAPLVYKSYPAMVLAVWLKSSLMASPIYHVSIRSF